MSVGRLAVDVPHVADLTLEPVVSTRNGLLLRRRQAPHRRAAPSSTPAIPRRLRS